MQANTLQQEGSDSKKRKESPNGSKENISSSQLRRRNQETSLATDVERQATGKTIAEAAAIKENIVMIVVMAM